MPAPSPRGADLVFTAPAGVPIEATARLDLLVVDVIRMATALLHVGGRFWNGTGFALLEPVVVPALTRGVELDLWTNTSTDEFTQTPLEWASRVRSHGTVRENWYQSEGGSLMHAKFVVADTQRGYSGTANLTSLFMTAHVEIGAEPTARQCGRLLDFLMLLEAYGRFSPVPRAPW